MLHCRVNGPCKVAAPSKHIFKSASFKNLEMSRPTPDFSTEPQMHYSIHEAQKTTASPIASKQCRTQHLLQSLRQASKAICQVFSLESLKFCTNSSAIWLS